MIKKTGSFIVSLAMAVLVVFAATAIGQPSKKDKPPTSTVTGRVTIDDKPAGGVPVVINTCDNNRYPNGPPTATATTDGEGLYRLTGLPAGHYCVYAFAPAWVVQPKVGDFAPGLTVGDGEIVEDINVALKKGGVITGRILDSDGEPVVSESVEAVVIDDKGNQVFRKGEPTDDRGIYRIYGLAPGKYKVRAGIGMVDLGGQRTHPITYYADEASTTDLNQAKLVTVSGDAEATDIDITIHPLHTHLVSGTVVNDQNGQPLPNVKVICIIQAAGGRSHQMVGESQRTTDARGKFTFTGVTVGHYAVRIAPANDVDFFGDFVNFDVEESDVSGLVLKAKTSGSISGTVVMNKGGNADFAARISKLTLYVVSFPTGTDTALLQSAHPGPDGTFRLTGLPPGTTNISFVTDKASAGFRIVRMERGGTEVKIPIPVQAGEAITDFRIILAYGGGTIRGDLQIEGLPVPQNMHFRVIARSFTQPTIVLGSAEIDARGQFVLANLPAGRYRVTVSTTPAPSQAPVRISFDDAMKVIDVTEDTDITVALILKLSPIPEKPGKP